MKPARGVRLAAFACCALLPVRVLADGEPISSAFEARARTAPGPGPVKAFFSLLLSAYRIGVSPADGPTCAFAPTCAGYAKEALASHGLAEGILMTGDRLLRCNPSDKSIYPRVGPDARISDPVPPRR